MTPGVAVASEPPRLRLDRVSPPWYPKPLRLLVADCESSENGSGRVRGEDELGSGMRLASLVGGDGVLSPALGSLLRRLKSGNGGTGDDLLCCDPFASRGD